MAGLPVVIVDSGGMAVTISETESGFPMELATNGFGIAVTIVESGGVPVTGLGAVILLSSTTIDEDASIGDAIGTLSVSIATGNWADPITYTITADPDSKFAVDGDILEIDAALDYETATSHSVTIEADNGTDDPITRTFTIIVNDLTEVPIASGPIGLLFLMMGAR